MIYGSWDIKCNFFVILGHFLPFFPARSPKYENIKKMKKTPGDTIILHRCTKWLYCSWDMACDGCNYFFILGYTFPFYPFPPPPNCPKNENFKKWKQYLEIPTFITSVPRIMIICFTAPEIWHVTDVIVIFHYGLFLPFLPLPARKIKISKKCKKHLEISSFYTIVIFCQKPWSYALLFLRYDAWQM